MRSQELDLRAYHTDKITNRTLELYDRFFAPLADQPVNLLEIGVYRGGSVRLWQDYFPFGQVVGLDMQLPPGLDDEPRIRLYQGGQHDAPLLRRIAAENAPDGFDVIIDDASHIGINARASFDVLFDDHLKPGGWYVIEDWPTGYFDEWEDGVSPGRRPGFWQRVARRVVRWGVPELKRAWPTHAHGMVGFVKWLVDEQAAADASRGALFGPNVRETRFESLTITPTLVFIKKKAGEWSASASDAQ
jgi:hypothetical protein